MLTQVFSMEQNFQNKWQQSKDIFGQKFFEILNQRIFQNC